MRVHARLIDIFLKLRIIIFQITLNFRSHSTTATQELIVPFMKLHLGTFKIRLSPKRIFDRF